MMCDEGDGQVNSSFITLFIHINLIIDTIYTYYLGCLVDTKAQRDLFTETLPYTAQRQHH